MEGKKIQFGIFAHWQTTVLMKFGGCHALNHPHRPNNFYLYIYTCIGTRFSPFFLKKKHSHYYIFLLLLLLLPNQPDVPEDIYPLKNKSYIGIHWCKYTKFSTDLDEFRYSFHNCTNCIYAYQTTFQNNMSYCIHRDLTSIIFLPAIRRWIAQNAIILLYMYNVYNYVHMNLNRFLWNLRINTFIRIVVS